MLLQTLLAMLLAALPAAASSTSAAPPALEGRGRVAWFEGSYAEALAEASR